MLHRDQILSVLEQLPLWHWPVFFFEVWWFERYYRAYRAANPVGMIGISITHKGRIIITLQGAGDRPAPSDWTLHAPRAPWARVDLSRLAAAFSVFTDAVFASARNRPAIGLAPACDRPAIGPLMLDPG